MRRRKLIAIIPLLVCSAIASQAGGPAFVAGSGYDPGIEGEPLIWASGSIQYVTDQGDLSPTVTGAQADTMVATAFGTWTTIAGVSLTASQAGHLAEDVNGSNIVVAADGTITAPADITSSATSTPVGIVYDYDGTVTDALLGEGAGSAADCFINAVYGGPDNFSTSGNIVHALVVINGVCAATTAQLPDAQYRLTRVLGRIIGLGWSQANVNVLTRNPIPSSDDFAGFPLMHFTDPISCVPISVCYNDATVPKMDDIDALARLYPVAANPQPAGRVYGSVYFTDASGTALQQMQGVNVVARLMVSGQPSGQYVATSVSGFAFTGNAGNIIDGYLDGNGLRYDRWGSNDPSLEGYFDLGELPIPTGQTIAEYQLSVEALDPVWSQGVEPYGPTQVTPSGSFAPVVVTVSNGSNAERDILMLDDEIAQTHPGDGSTYASPAALPQGGAWGSWISGYGSVDFFEFTAQANRTASVSVVALDETGQPTETKLLPVIGIWQLSDPTGNPAPASTPSAFNSTTFAMTRLDAQFIVTDTFRVGVADFRGDGRPDYFYQASLLYSDSVTPARISLAGGVAALNGIGFRPGLQVNVAGSDTSVLSLSASQIESTMPPAPQDGIASIQVTDPVTGAFSQMIGALTYGALPSDLLLLLQGAESGTIVGAQGPSPIRVQAVAADGVTPVNGATIAWSGTNGLQFSACDGAASCSVLSDEAGESSSWVTPTAIGASTVTIALAPASYTPPQTQQATVSAGSTGLDLAALSPISWIAQGATISVPLTVEALSMGIPTAGLTINFAVMKGSVALSSPSLTTNTSGLATINAQLANQNAEAVVSACVAPNNAPCQAFTLFSTAPSQWKLETVSGSLQVVPIGQSFEPLVMRVTDGSPTDNPVMGANVIFQTTLSRGSDSHSTEDGLPILLGSSQAQVVTDQNGLASIVPTVGNVGPCDVFIVATTGPLIAQFQMESLAVIVPVTPSNSVQPPTPAHATHIFSNFTPQAVALQALPTPYFAVPPIIPNADPNSSPNNDQTAESNATDYTELSLDGSSNPEIPDQNAVSPTDNFAASTPKVAPATADDSAETARESAAKKAAVAAETLAPPSTPVHIEDERSCRGLATDSPI
jgi:hypothetical protein